ncbi:hypothetical protein ACQJBY_019385 [Aegilops geniculata]
MERAPEHRPQKLSVAAGVGGGGGEDRLSALPDDVLIHILLKLCDAALAARTSALARRWRRVWALLPDLHFPVGTDPGRIRAALTAHDAPALRYLFVAAIEVTPESAAAWLPIAARRLSGVLHFKNRGDMNEASAGERGALELPCFEKATKVCGDERFLMEEMTKLPNITTLGLVVLACGHSFGAGSFHVLKMSSGIRELTLQLVTRSDCKAFAACQSGCICAEPSNWETEDLVLPCLKELAINDLRGTERELALVKRLFKWATMLERVAVIFHDSIAESNREELRRLLLSFSRPAICMKFLLGGCLSFD